MAENAVLKTQTLMGTKTNTQHNTKTNPPAPLRRKGVKGVRNKILRDNRLTRGVRQVLNKYSIGRPKKRDDGTMVVNVSPLDGVRTYLVTITEDWSEPPICTCPDSKKIQEARESSAQLCKHCVAVLIKTEAYSYQLIDYVL